MLIARCHHLKQVENL